MSPSPHHDRSICVALFNFLYKLYMTGYLRPGHTDIKKLNCSFTKSFIYHTAQGQDFLLLFRRFCNQNIQGAA